jgi:hypothetical protein
MLPIREMHNFNLINLMGEYIGHATSRPRLGLLRAFVALTSKSRHHLNGIGGDAEIVYLPDLGIEGNTHLLMLDLNNVQIADIVSTFLTEKALDGQKP